MRSDVLAGKAALPAVRAVLDTNVIVSALLKDGGREALLVDLAQSGSFKLVVSEALLEEYEEVLRRPGFGFNPTQITGSLRAIRDSAIVVHPQKRLHVTRDPDDNKVLERALEGRGRIRCHRQHPRLPEGISGDQDNSSAAVPYHLGRPIGVRIPTRRRSPQSECTFS